MNNNISSIPNFVSVSDLQRDYPGLLKKLKSSGEPLLVLKNNSLEAVMLSPEKYKELRDKIVECEEAEALRTIEGYKKEKKSGKLKKMKSVNELFE